MALPRNDKILHDKHIPMAIHARTRTQTKLNQALLLIDVAVFSLCARRQMHITYGWYVTNTAAATTTMRIFP